MENPRVFTLLNGDIEPRVQEVEIASSFQIPHFQMIGLPGPEVSEAKDRIRAAIEAAGFEFPKRKIVLNLSPASVRKQGTGLDLAMAIAVMLEGLRIEKKLSLAKGLRIFAWAELGLNGQVKAVRSPARALSAAITGKADLILISKEDRELFKSTAENLFHPDSLPPRIAISHLSEVLPILKGEVPTSDREQDTQVKTPTQSSERKSGAAPRLLPITPELAKILQIAASGSHHFLLLGPKGVGKSQAIEWFLALQPTIDQETLRTRTFLAEISGKNDMTSYRRVSTQTKPASLVGSFSNGFLRPGEFSLAHGGVLIADEFPEWHRDSREALREPLERKKISLTRVDGSYELPCDFIFAGNGNLCPCGGVPEAPSDSHITPCRCIPNDRAKYLARLSGPILDRLDLVSTILHHPTQSSELIGFTRLSEEVAAARKVLHRTWGCPPGKLSAERLEDILRDHSLLREDLDRLNFRSFRDRHKTLRIALTLAGLRGLDTPSREILREARIIRLQSERALGSVH